MLMFLRILLITCGLISNSLCKPLDETTPHHKSILDDSRDLMEPQLGQSKAYSESSKTSRDQSSPTNPLAGFQNLLGNGSLGSNGQSSNPGGMPPVMVLGMHQAIIVPLTSLPGIFQGMMNGIFNPGNSQQGSNLIPGVPNIG